MNDREALVEDLVYRCLAARAGGESGAVDRLLAEQTEDMRDAVTGMLGLLERVGLAGEVPAPTESAATPFGPYLLLERLGAGSMGVVYRARDPSGDERALKVLQPGLLSARRARWRFDREIRALRELDHPGICRVLDAGEVGGVPFLVMPLLHGEGLHARFARGPARTAPEREELLAIIEHVATALHHAHERGFVHRDVKPANIRIGEDGRPVLLDFGLARLDRDDDGSLTQSREVIGAPAYMAPEQITDSASVDRRADVYALGVVLYEGLTGSCPYEAATRESLYRRILVGDAAPPSRRLAGVPGACDVVCLTALASNRDRRYQTAAALAADVARVRAGRRPSAQLPGPIERTQQWVRRNPLPSTLIALLVLAVAGVLWQTVRQQRTAALDRARVLAAEAFDVLPSDPRRAESLALSAHELAPDLLEPLTAVEAARAETEELVLVGHTQPVNDLEFAADGEHLVSASLDGTARVWSLRDATVRVLQHGGGGPVLASLQPGGNLVVTAGFTDGRVCAWRADSGELAWQHAAHPAGSAVRVLRWSPDGRWLVTGGADGGRLWSPDGTSRVLQGTPPAVAAAAWLAGDLVALGGGSNSPSADEVPPLRACRVADDTIVTVADCPLQDGVVALRPRPGASTTALVVGSSSTAYLWDVSTNVVRALPRAQPRGVYDAAWSGGGRHALTIARGGTLAIHDPEGENPRIQQTLPYPACVLPHPHHAYAALAGGNGVIQLRSYAGPGSVLLGRRQLRPLPTALSADGLWLAACDWDNAIRVWRTWRPEQPVFLVGDVVRSAVWSEDGRTVVTGSYRNRPAGAQGVGIVHSWNTDTGKHHGSVEVDTAISNLLLDRDRSLLYVLHASWETGAARVVGDASGQLQQRDGTGGDSVPLRGVLDGKLLPGGRFVMVTEDNHLVVYDPSSNEVVQRTAVVPPGASPSAPGILFAVAARADGSTVWCGGTARYLHRFDRGSDGTYVEVSARPLAQNLRSLECVDDGSLVLGMTNGLLQRHLPDETTVVPFAGHRDDVIVVAWTRAGGELRIASGDGRGSVRLWRDDGTPMREIRAHAGPVWAVSFSPLGDRLLTGSADGTARIWPVDLRIAR